MATVVDRHTGTGHAIVKAQDPEPGAVEHMMLRGIVATKRMVGHTPAERRELIVPRLDPDEMAVEGARTGAYRGHAVGQAERPLQEPGFARGIDEEAGRDRHGCGAPVAA